MTLTSDKRLNPQQQQAFADEGYLLFQQDVFPAEDFAALQVHFEQLLAEQEAAGKRPEAMDVPHFSDPSLFRWLLHDAVLDIIEPLLGPDIALFSSHFICKPGGDGKRVPWHEDSAYWAGRLDPMEVVTLWLAIDPSTEANGCMRVIPRSHTSPDSAYEATDKASNVFDTRIKPEDIDESQAVSCILQPNQCSLHDGRLIHGSEPNDSSQRRCGYTMRYVSANTRYLWDDGFQLYLARGRNIHDQAYGDPSRPNEAWLKNKK